MYTLQLNTSRIHPNSIKSDWNLSPSKVVTFLYIGTCLCVQPFVHTLLFYGINFPFLAHCAYYIVQLNWTNSKSKIDNGRENHLSRSLKTRISEALQYFRGNFFKHNGIPNVEYNFWEQRHMLTLIFRPGCVLEGLQICHLWHHIFQQYRFQSHHL